MMRLMITAVMLSISMAGVAQSGKLKVNKTQDKFEGTETVTMEGNKVTIDGAAESAVAKGLLGLLSGNVQISRIRTEMNLEKHTTPQAQELSVIVTIEIKDDAGFYIDNGESLIFLADSERVALSTQGEFGTERGYKEHKTNARYAITKEQLQTLIHAENISFRILNGGFMERNEEVRDKDGQYFEGELSEKNVARWREFARTYL
ncbi:MAG: hypothetical protein RLP14_10415 [Owenweeksia sp.]